MIINEELRTPWKIRLTVGIIGVLMLGSTLAIYFGVVVQYGAAQDATSDPAAKTALEQRYTELSPVVSGYAKTFSDRYFSEFLSYKPQVAGFNEEALQYDARDLKHGDGAEITAATDPYLAYYIGWKSDETVIDSSYDNLDTPTSLKTPLPGSTSMIRGWLEGIIGMKIGGVREISIPSDYAYGNGALKFIVMLIPHEGSEYTDITEFNNIQMQLSQMY